jgi:type II secretory ATPase GspE/PulE/Tfp pilus assembly ATPase PilB-like protein/FixJ family two-component response regulator
MSRLASLFIDSKKGPVCPDLREADEPDKTVYRILFVDDEEYVLKAMLRIFRRENYKLLTVVSAAEALDMLKAEPIQVIISDYRMPGMNGADLLRKIKELYPQTIRIMLTGFADVNAIMGAINDGAVYKFITKPWNDDDLRLTVSLALEQYDLIQENKALKTQREVQEKKLGQMSRFFQANRSQIGRVLLKKGVINKDQLDKALALQARKNQILPLILTELGAVGEKAIMETIQTEFGIDRVYPKEFTVSRALAALIPKNVCQSNYLVPLKRTDRTLIVAMADPTDFIKVDDLKFLTGIPIQPVLASSNEITEKLKEVYDVAGMIDTAMSDLNMMDPTETIEIVIDEEDGEVDIEELLSAKDQPPAVRIVNAIMSDALRHEASDVHIEPKSKYVMVRYRIDGLLQDKIHIPLAMHPMIVSRIKIMAELDISERRKPQDGRITVKSASRMVDMRISTLPTIRGEKIVLRVLDKNAAVKGLSSLGFSEKDFKTVKRCIAQPQGIILSTGPTGSGKTSTLYSLLQEGATITKNFTTIEEPIEYFLDMAEQVNVRHKIGLDFPMIMRSLLRQDPDVILLGEIRDFETSEVAFQAALTGHLVLSTLHTNGTVASITRLKDMGVKPYVISEAILCIISQRLVRRICHRCKTEEQVSDELLTALGLDGKHPHLTQQKGHGCEYCHGTGYQGRIGIFEVFPVTSEIKKMIRQDVGEIELMRVARLGGMTTFLEDAMEKVALGQITCEEIVRVLGVQNIVEIVCPHCRLHLGETFHFCPFCGGAINRRCTGCGGILNADWHVCPSCGKKYDQGASASDAASLNCVDFI